MCWFSLTERDAAPAPRAPVDAGGGERRVGAAGAQVHWQGVEYCDASSRDMLYKAKHKHRLMTTGVPAYDSYKVGSVNGEEFVFMDQEQLESRTDKFKKTLKTSTTDAKTVVSI